MQPILSSSPKKSRPSSVPRKYSTFRNGKSFSADPELIAILNRRTRKAGPFAGPAGRIRQTLQVEGHTKWGFVVYRCDYADDEAFMKLLSNIYHEAAYCLKVLEAEDLQPALDFTVKEDRKSLDGATIDQVRGIFNEWVKSDEAKAENNNTAYPAIVKYPRYNFCIHVDADAIDSIVRRAPQPPQYDADEIGYVTLVQLLHDEELEDTKRCESGMEDEEDDGEDFTKMNDVKVPIWYLGAESYGNLHEYAMWERLVRYRRSDGVSYGQSLSQFLYR